MESKTCSSELSELVDWNKIQNMLPVIVQCSGTGTVLMLGYMNQEALLATEECGNVVFFSRSKQRLWMKGEQSGNTLRVLDMQLDCDRDSLLVRAQPTGPTCHLGTQSCFARERRVAGFLGLLEQIISERFQLAPEASYVARLREKGAGHIAQKVGEEAVEVAVASAQGQKEEVIEESADLLFHLLVNLKQQDVALAEVLNCLQKRHTAREEARA